MDLRQSKEFAQYMKLSDWIVEKADNCYVYLRKLPLLPPLIMKAQYPTPPIPFEKIEELAKKYKPFQIQIQPLKIESGFKKYGYKLSGGGHVTKTLQIDLTQPEKKILTQMKKDARYGIRKAEKEDIKILRYKNIKKFHQAWKKSVGWRKYVPSLKTLKRLKKAFGKKALFFLATIRFFEQSEKQGSRRRRGSYKPYAKMLAGTIILIANDSTYYYYAFTSKEGRQKFAQYLLVWEAIKLAKKQGCKIFDFEGVYDERFPIKAWKGFSHFKRSFGGEEIEYPGVFTKSRLRI